VLRRAALLTADVGRFEIDLGRPLGYDAGQFVLVEMEGCAGPRAYSMTRASDGTGSLGLLIRRFEGGEFTERLFAPSFEACRVSVVGPLGRAVFGADEARPFVALAGGSGIAGMLGILDAAAACGQFARHRNAVVFGVRDARAAYLLDELDAMASSAGEGLCVVVAFSDMAPDAESRIRFPHLRFASGFVHEVAAQLPEGLIGPDTVHFVAGPPLMVDATLRWLVLDRKVPTTEIRYDRFG
jgi:toluene monooxygenase electron transfer component